MPRLMWGNRVEALLLDSSVCKVVRECTMCCDGGSLRERWAHQRSSGTADFLTWARLPFCKT